MIFHGSVECNDSFLPIRIFSHCLEANDVTS